MNPKSDKDKLPEDLNIIKGTIIPPKNGWQQRTYYVVDVAYASNNPIHRKILYTGFLTRLGNLGGSYCAILMKHPDDYEFSSIGRAYYIKAIRAINMEG